MSKRVRSVSIFMVALGVMIFVLGTCSRVQAQDDKRGLLYFKMGSNSKIDSSDLDAKFNFGFGGAYKIKPHIPLFLESSFTMNKPYKEIVYDYGDPLAYSVKTMLVDVNGTFVIRSSFLRLRSRFFPYATGGVGFLRNSAGLSDGYSSYTLDSSTFFTKNVGSGARVVIKGSIFAGVEARYYWVDRGNFKTFSGTIGFLF